MPYLAINGVDHYYEWIGSDAPSGTKPVMVFLHGWAGSTRYWTSTAIALQDQFDCLLYDLRGFGRSRLPQSEPGSAASTDRSTALDDYALERYADDLAALLDALGLESIYLNGHSTGASIAVYFLNRYGDRVQQAILTCNGIFAYNKLAFEAFYFFGRIVVAFRPAWLGRIPFAPQLFMQRFLRRSLPAAICQDFLADFLMADQAACMGTIYTAVSERETQVLPAHYRQLQVPTLLVSGQYDQIIPAELGRQAAALNDRVQHVIMADTGHFPMLEDPETYLGVVRQFLQQPVTA